MAERNYTTTYENDVLVKEFKDGTKVEVGYNDLPEASQVHVRRYGLTQLLNDCHAGAKTLEEMIKASVQKAEDLAQGVIRRRAAGLGLGVDLEKLTQALANVKFKGDLDKAKASLEPFIPDDEADDEDTVKNKKARLRAIRNFGAIKMELDRLEGKSLDKMLEGLEEEAA